MKERDITADIVKLLAYKSSGACEVKLTKTGSLPFAALAPHQKAALLHVRRSTLVFKIPDGTFSQSPFDIFVLTQAQASVCVVYYEPRKLKEAVFIDIEVWVEEETNSTRKSLTLARAREIGVSHTL